MKLKSKLLTGAVAFAMVFGALAIPAGAQTTAELTAQINSLLAMIAQLQSQISGQATVGGSAVVFNTDLTIGSRGSDVTELQQWLVTKGFLQMPAGVAYGYFGPLTQSAVSKYQAEAGISPTAGYFGPITRARLNAMTTTGGGTTGGTVTCPAGYTCTSTTGGSTGITTPGVEGTLTVSSNNSGLASTVYEGDSMVSILGFNVEAKTSDIAVQRIKINLGTNSKMYTKGYSKLYITDGSNVLASVDLNSSTVVKEGSNYYITVSGFNFIVPKNSKKQIVVKADVMSSIDTTDRSTLSLISITLADSGVRGIDGAGIDQYSPTTGSTVSRSVSFSAELAENATMKLSLNSSSPKKQDVVASSGANENELDKLTLAIFDVKAEKDDVTITDWNIGVVKSGSGAAVAQTAYLFDGSTELDNVSVANGMAQFTDLDYLVSKDTTKSLTLKVDIRSANGTVANFVGQASTTAPADFATENSLGDSVTESGSATGYSIGIRNVGPEISLLSKSITTAGAPQVTGTDNSTSTLTATFTVRVKAVGGDIVLGLTQSTTSPFFASTTPASGSKGYRIYRNGTEDTTISSNATSTSFTVPSNCVTTGTNTCILSEGDSVDVPLTIQVQGRTITSAPFTSGLYSVGIAALNWSGNTSSFMDGELDWRTSEVSFP